ncbi:MAG: CHASE domain-containing protein [Rubripirellula sp.]
MLRWFHWLVIVFSLGLTFFAWNIARRQQNARVALQFEREAEQTVALIVERMEKYEEALWAGVAFLSTVDGNVDNKLWTRYAETLKIEQKYPGISGIGVIAALDRDQAAKVLEQERIDRPDFAYHPPRDADQYWPILHISPVQGNEKAVGLDMAHEANRIVAARKSLDSGTAQVTAPIVLVQDELQTPGFLFYAPFRAGGPGEIDQGEYDGLVYAPFVCRELLAGTLDKDLRHVGVRISDEADVLFDELVTSEADFDPEPLLKKKVSLEVYGRTWQFDLWSSKSFRSSIDTTQTASILVGGLLLDTMLVLLFLVISRSARRSLHLADELTSDLASFGLAARVNQIGVFDFNPVSGDLKWNDAMFDIFGQDKDEFQPSYQSWGSCVHPDDLKAAEETVAASLAEGNSFASEFRVIHPNGAIRHLNANGVVFRDSDGQAIRLLGANTDITRQTKANQELERSRQLQAAIHDSAGVSMIATDPAGLILQFNSTAEQMLGYSKEVVEKRVTPAMFHDLDEVIARAGELSEELGRTIEPGFEVFVAKAKMAQAEQREWTYIRKDGSSFPVLLTVTALRDVEGQITGFLGVAADISERKQAIQEIQKSNAQLARSNEELAQFAYVASHDLQEPLRKVTSFCEMLQEDCSDQLSDDGLKYMGFIVDGAQRMRALIQDLLAYSRVDNETLRTTDVDMRAAVEQAIDNLSEAIAQCDAEVLIGDLPVVQADQRQMVQLFQNLIGNAIKYQSDTKPRVEIGAESIADHWRFWVDDNGIGIQPEFRAQIFGIFKRLHRQNEYPGTGIGLAVCKRIVDRLDGRIWVEESPAGGCRFLFEFLADQQ